MRDSGANLESCAQREQQVIMPESQHKALELPLTTRTVVCY